MASSVEGKGEITSLNVKPAVGFTLPSAGVTAAPSDKKSRNDEDAISLSYKGRVREVATPKIRFPFPLGKGLGVRLVASTTTRGGEIHPVNVAIHQILPKESLTPAARSW